MNLMDSEENAMTTDTNQPVRVPREVLDGIEAVRRSGRTNMLDRHAAALIAESLGFLPAALWIRENRELYARGIFQGFEAEDPR